MGYLFDPITSEEVEGLKKQIKELEKTLKLLKQRLDFYESQNVEQRIYAGGVASPADLEQAHAPIQEYDISQSSSTNDIIIKDKLNGWF